MNIESEDEALPIARKGLEQQQQQQEINIAKKGILLTLVIGLVTIFLGALTYFNFPENTKGA